MVLLGKQWNYLKYNTTISFRIPSHSSYINHPTLLLRNKVSLNKSRISHTKMCPIFTTHQTFHLLSWSFLALQGHDQLQVTCGKSCCRSETLTMDIQPFRYFWDVAPCSLVETDRLFRGPCCLHLQGPYSIS
jgi:hypothetical protein